ncbi:MAG TPA: hypothetical protein VFG23_19220 [Polyangia bacterium]|nr:hypothetical protein [Polyangia bacterium]
MATHMDSPVDFEIGQRVRINYGAGTVVSLHRGSVMVAADVGQAWIRDVGDVLSLDVEGPLDNWFERTYLAREFSVKVRS